MRIRLAECLAERRVEIEDAIAARVQAVEDPSAINDPEYASALWTAIRAVMGQAIFVIEDSGIDSQEVPAELIAQARLAALNDVGLDTVLRSYVACHGVLCDYLLREAVNVMAPPASSGQALQAEAALLDRIIREVTRAYREELERRDLTSEGRRAEGVRRLLAGEPQDVPELGYDLESWHLGVIAKGAGAPSVLRELAAALDRGLLAIRHGEREIWAWLGGRRLEGGEVIKRVDVEQRSGLVLAIGEPGRGIPGWRLSHRQAKAALPVAVRMKPGFVHYAEVALLASALADEVLSHSLEEAYLKPLAHGRDGGVALMQTLQAYFDAERNVTAAAASLGISRPTVTSRLRAAEERIGLPLGSCAAEIETVLRLRGLDRP